MNIAYMLLQKLNCPPCRTKAAKDEEATARTQDILAYPAVSTNFVTLNRKGASPPKPMPNRTLLKAPGH